MEIKTISQASLFIFCAFLGALGFLPGTTYAESKKSFYITPAYSALKENNNFITTYLTSSVTLQTSTLDDPADPNSPVTIGELNFPGTKIPAIPAELDYEGFDGGAVVFGWNFVNQFSLELHLGEPRILGASYDIPAQTVSISNLIDPASLEVIGNPDPGEIEYDGVIGHLADVELLEIAIGSNYTFNLHEKYKLYMGAGILKYIELSTDIYPVGGINSSAVKSDFDSDGAFYFQAGFLYHLSDSFDVSFDIKQISAETTLTFSNIEVEVVPGTGVGSETTADSGDLVTKFDISGVMYHLGLRYSF